MSIDGQTCVQVLYDYEYETVDGRGISIQEGEELMLIRKTNDDWWQVLRDGENRPFYAPMSYLTINSDEDNNNHDDVNKRDVNFNEMVLYVSNPLYESAVAVATNKEPSDSGVDGVTVIHIPGPTNTTSTLINKDGNRSNESDDDDEDYESIDDDGTKSTDSAYNERLQKVAEEEEEAIYAVLEPQDFEDVQRIATPESPIYANFPLLSSATPPQPSTNEKPVKVLFNNWSEYCDDRGRKFYFNDVTKETTWKPPRRMNEGSSEDITSVEIKPDDPVEKVLPPTPPKKPKPKLVRRVASGKFSGGDASSSTDSLDSPSTPPVIGGAISTTVLKDSLSPHSSSLPRGWRLIRDPVSRENFYVNKHSKHIKWFSSVDESGRMYYYAENSAESFWELPEESSKMSKSDGREPSSTQSGKGGVPVAPPTVPAHILRSPKLSSVKSSDRRNKTHSVVEPSFQPPPPKSDKGSKSSSLPRGLTAPGKSEPQKQWPQLQDGCMVVTKQGTLNKTCLMEAGRRLKKHWTQAHVTLTHLYLLFYKDVKAAQQFQLNGSCKPEITLDLAGANIKRSADNSRRKNVFEITTVLGQHILLQDDNVDTSDKWFNAIESVILKLPSNTVWSNSLAVSPTPSPTKEKTKKGRQLSRKKSTKLKNSEGTLKNSDSGSNISSVPSGSTAVGDDSCTSPNERKKRIRDKLRNFFLRRPSMESLREKGIIKDEPVFGCHLENLCLRDKSQVPKFVQQCIEAIEKKDMSADGLYRASGNLSQVQKLRFQINQDDYSGLKTEEDVHVLTGALKMFFRDMKEPLFPFDTFDNFLAAISLNDKKVKLSSITDLIRTLPHCNGDTLRYLLRHLVRVTKLSDKNRMHVQNVAIVFGPTLLWPINDSNDLALDMMHQNQIIELLLLEFNRIFG